MADACARSGSTHHHKTWRTDPGRQDDTVLPYADRTGRVRDTLAHGFPPCDAFRADAVQRPPRLIPRFVTIAIRPSDRDEVGDKYAKAEFR